MKLKKAEEKIVIPEGVTIDIDKNIINVKGPKGGLQKKLLSKKIEIETRDNSVLIFAKKVTKREKTLIGSFKAHIKKMVIGVKEGHHYKLKICASHFPMNVSIVNKEFIVKNFLGEKFPRTLKLKDGVDVKVEGDIIVIESVDKELAGQTAADIERLTKIKNRDLRIFQDGIYIIEKDGKEVK